MVRGTTESGFNFELEDEVLDDYELLETLCELDNGNNSVITKMVDTLLGQEQKERLKEHIRNTKGRVSAKRMMEEIVDIFKSCNAGKNC